MNENTPIAVEGLPFAIPLLILSAALWYFGVRYPALFFTLLTIFVLWFFRNPGRMIPTDISAVISPADGTVIVTEEVNEGRYLKERALKVSVFMNVFNVHVNRAPYSGKVVDVIYNKGKFISANLDKASMDNEQNAVILDIGSGNRIMFVQIAGLIARRIVCYLKPGDSIEKGKRMGLIRFGSRLDVYLPIDSTLNVKIGDKVVAGETILGYLK
ncbi:MAG: phosphatidylserine decarboxylase family protein [Deltaproteobacteria bacterium]|nr:phosphatidylserine decarboxylase family protein [Deltaproteobacteria bacterium]